MTLLDYLFYYFIIFNISLIKKNKYLPNCDYLKKCEKNDNITKNQREILIEWLFEVYYVFKLKNGTFEYCINYLDRMLSIYYEKANSKNLQLIGITCLFISSKFNDGIVCIRKYSEITDHTFSEKDIIKMEEEILNILKFELKIITIDDFLFPILLFLKNEDDKKVYFLSKYIIDLNLLYHKLFIYKKSVIAYASIIIASINLNKKYWNPKILNLLNIITYEEKTKLKNCIVLLYTNYKNDFVTKRNQKKSSSFHIGYSSEKFLCIGLIKPKPIENFKIFFENILMK